MTYEEGESHDLCHSLAGVSVMRKRAMLCGGKPRPSFSHGEGDVKSLEGLKCKA